MPVASRFAPVLSALALSAASAQPVSLVASEFSAPTGSQANGFGDFETESTTGMLFYAAEGGRLQSLEFVLSDISGFVPEEAKTDVEIRFYTWENGTIGDELAFIDLPHEEIPDHVTQFTNWTWDEFDFPSRGLQVPIEAGRNYIAVFALRVPFTTPRYGRPNILGLARDREGPIYPAGEAVRRDADGSTIVFSRATEVSPDSDPGSLDFFHRVNVSRSPLATDANGDQSLDVFDAIEFLRGFDAGETDADYDLSGGFNANDISVFLSQVAVEASRE
ncbi:MAG: hypothetical protein AAGI17_04165 [Planctomycetota bacterium]